MPWITMTSNCTTIREHFGVNLVIFIFDNFLNLSNAT